MFSNCLPPTMLHRRNEKKRKIISFPIDGLPFYFIFFFHFSSVHIVQSDAFTVFQSFHPAFNKRFNSIVWPPPFSIVWIAINYIQRWNQLKTFHFSMNTLYAKWMNKWAKNREITRKWNFVESCWCCRFFFIFFFFDSHSHFEFSSVPFIWMAQ